MDQTKSEPEHVKIRKRRPRHRHPKRKTSFWLMIILVITFILSAITMNIPSLIDKYLNFMDKTYIPMDIYEQAKQAALKWKK